MPRVRRCRQPNCHAMVELPNHYCVQHFSHEAEYLASRAKWARGNNKRKSHIYNTVTRYRDDVKTSQYSFYRTKQWVNMRQRVLDTQHYICQYCGAINSKIVDHTVPIEARPELKDSLTNLAVICIKCHRLKTDWEKEYYGTGQGNSLNDVVPIENINQINRMMKK